MKNDTESIAKVKVGTVIQIDPAFEHNWAAAAFAQVTAKETWGIIAKVPIPPIGEAPAHQAIVRLTWNFFEPVGEAVWSPEGERTKAVEPLKHHP